MVVTSKRALVLAGGGVAGIAWETGVLRGIADESPATATALLASDVLVGTSAGSAVSAQIGSGTGIDELYARQIGDSSPELDPGVGGPELAEMFLAAMTRPNTTAVQKMQRIGAVALAAETVPVAVRRKVIERRLPSHQWPDRCLRITAIDIDTGVLRVFDPDSGVELVDAVAASCAVPGVWPPVVIDGRRYMDGGMRSAINLDVADDCDAAVVLVPSGEGSPTPFGPGAAAEIAAFEGRVHAVFADRVAVRAFGTNPLDPACRIPSAQSGREQGRRNAADIAEFLAG